MKIIIVNKYKCVLQPQRSIVKLYMYDGLPIFNCTSPVIRLNRNTSIGEKNRQVSFKSCGQLRNKSSRKYVYCLTEKNFISGDAEVAACLLCDRAHVLGAATTGRICVIYYIWIFRTLKVTSLKMAHFAQRNKCVTRGTSILVQWARWTAKY
jgi:hypothetical protein